MYKKISEKAKLRLVARYQAGELPSKICGESGIPRSTLYYWTRLYQVQVSQAGNVVTPKQLDSAKRRIRKYEDIIGVLQEVDCTPNAPLKNRLAALEPLHGKYSVHTLCEALNVSRGTFYNHILRSKRENAWHIKRRSELAEAIRNIYDNSNQIFGAGKIRAVLVSQGYRVSDKIVSELMREIGLYSISRSTKKIYRTSARNERKTNKLRRNFDVDKPDKVWVSDVTYYRLKGRHFFICAVIDLYSRKILALTVGRNNSTHLVKSAFVRAHKDRCSKNLTLHTDRGTAYSSYSMEKLLRQSSVIHSFSRPGSPCDNAVVESFFSNLKKEELYRVAYKSEAELRTSLDKYVKFYNTERPHEYLKYKTPDEAERLYQSDGEAKINS